MIKDSSKNNHFANSNVRMFDRPYHKRGEAETLKLRGNINIDPGAIVWTHDESSSLVTRGEGRILIGQGSFLNCGIWIRAAELVWIGANVLVGPRVMIMDNDAHEVGGNHHIGGSVSPVMIKDNAWLCAGAIILKGVTIGVRSVVGAGSVVTHNVPDRVVVAGNPAKIIRRIE